MDELYLDNIDEFVNDHDKIVSAPLIRNMSVFLDFILGEIMPINQRQNRSNVSRWTAEKILRV